MKNKKLVFSKLPFYHLTLTHEQVGDLLSALVEAQNSDFCGKEEADVYEKLWMIIDFEARLLENIEEAKEKK